MSGGGVIDYNDGSQLKVGELKDLLAIHNLSTQGTKPNLYARLRNFMRNHQSSKNFKLEKLPLPTWLPSGKNHFGNHQIQCNAPNIFEVKGAETQTDCGISLSKFDGSEKKMVETQTELKSDSKKVGPDGTSSKVAKSQTDLKVESKMIGPDASITKMVETQTDLKIESKMVGPDASFPKIAETQTHLKIESKMVGPNEAFTKMVETQTESNLVNQEAKTTETQTDYEASIQEFAELNDELDNGKKPR